MFKLQLIASFLAAASLLMASPIQKRALGGVLICEGANGVGNCSYKVYEMEKCYNLPAPFHNNAATFAPDDAPFYCYPYLMDCGGICTSPTGCTFGSVSFKYAHKNNLTAIGWDKLITSFECHANRNQTLS